MAKIFLSYSRKDIMIMRRVKKYLEAAEYDVWTDEGIEPGTESWKQEIANAIESSQALVVILSPDAKSSKWVQEELNYAQPRNVKIYPLLARGDAKSAVPFGFSASQWIDIRKDFKTHISELLDFFETRDWAKQPELDQEVDIDEIKRRIIYEGDKPLTVGDLISACKAQVESVIYGVGPKYNPGLYVNRAIEVELATFFENPLDGPAPNCYLIVAPAGSGKTNLLCHLAHAQVTRQPTLLLMGGSLYLKGGTGLFGGMRLELEQANSEVALRADGDTLHALHHLGKELNQDVLLMIDAINEYERPGEMRKALEDILRKTRGKRIKLLITCRDYYWGLFKGSFWEGTVINGLPDEDETAEDDFNQFSLAEHEQALKLYLEHYHIIGQPVGDAAEQCRHPLLLRFFCEGYRGRDVGKVEDIRLQELFDQYWEQKLVSIADRMTKQGEERLQDGLAQEVGDYLLNIARHMLHENERAIPLHDIPKATKQQEKYDDPRSVYGRIRDEFIILEEKELGKGQRKLQVAFVYEEFMEYVMARSLITDWDRELDEAGILAAIEEITKKYDEFAQILGVMVYLAVMLKKERDLALWYLLLSKGKQWQQVVFEAFRKLPEEQLDSSVFGSLEEMIRTDDKEILIQVLDVLKVKRVGKAATQFPSMITQVSILAKDSQEPIARRAILALEHNQSDLALPVIIDALGHSGEAVRRNAETVLLRKKQLAVEPLADALRDQDWEARNNAVVMLGMLKNERAVDPLIDALKDNQLEVRLSVVNVLGQLMDVRAVSPLIEALNDNYWEVRDRVVEVLGKFEDERAVDPLIDALKDDQLEVRLSAMYALERLLGVGAVDLLIGLLKDDHWEVRKCAVNLLGVLWDERVVEPIADLLKDDRREVRNSVVNALVRFGDERAVKPLIDALKDEHIEVRNDAVDKLGEMGDVAVLPLISVLKSNNEKLRKNATRTLGRMWDVAVLPLIDALTDDDWIVRTMVTDALGQLGDERAVEPLIAALKDNESIVRESAADALYSIGTTEAVAAADKYYD